MKSVGGLKLEKVLSSICLYLTCVIFPSSVILRYKQTDAPDTLEDPICASSNGLLPSRNTFFPEHFESATG